MRNLLFLARADLGHTLRAKETLVWTFLMPLLFFFFFTRMNMGGGSGGSGGGDLLRIESAGPGGVVLSELERRLTQQKFVLQSGSSEESVRRILEVPADLDGRVLAAEPTTLRLRRDTSGFSANFDDVRVMRALYTVLADLAVLRAAGEPLEPVSFENLAAAPRSLELTVEPAGARRVIPSGNEHTIPGTLVMFTLIVLLTSGCVPVVIERRAGLLRRLASTPMSRAEILGGRWLSTFGLGLVQIGYALLVGTLLFGMRWGPNPFAVAAVLVPWAALVASMALLLSSLVRTESQVVGAGVLAANVLAALGGCWWPIEITPDWMQKLASLLPTGWIMTALHKLISFQDPPGAVLPQVALMALAAIAVFALGARLFRYE